VKQAFFAPFGFLRFVGTQPTKDSPHKKVQDMELVEVCSRQVPIIGRASQLLLQTIYFLRGVQDLQGVFGRTVLKMSRNKGSFKRWETLGNHTRIVRSPLLTIVSKAKE